MLLTPLLAALMLVLSFARWIPGVPPIVGRIQSLLQTIGIDYLGDIYFYFTDEAEGTQVCGGLQRMLQEIGENSNVTEIFLYCHSTGNVIAYEALAKLHESNSPSAQTTLSKVKAFIGTGSILGMAWNPRIVKHSGSRGRFQHTFAGITCGPSTTLVLRARSFVTISRGWRQQASSIGV